MSSALTLVKRAKSFGGSVQQFKHVSACTNTEMVFTVFLPPQAVADATVPVLYWLSGLTCTDENFITKAGAQRVAARHGIALVCPDTSPRGAGIDGEDDSWDFGTGAGFYVNATQPLWSKHYNMYDYVTKELPSIVNAEFPVDPKSQSIFGHSMGGHGALIAALKNPGMYKSVSAFAPICNPTECAWGHKAFGGYLGDDKETWKPYDATLLVADYTGPDLHILVDQGTEDGFLTDGQLRPDAFEAACKTSPACSSAVVRMQEGYDHSYYFISSFAEDHIAHHAKYLTGAGAADA